MATFSLGSGATPGAPGVYINERAGLAAAADVADFSTVYMLVETEESVPVTLFPFNTPTPVSSLADYRALLGGVIPTERIPALSYNCVNEFYQNAQVGDLRVVRVGTPNQIVEIEILPSGSKINSTDLPSALMAGNKVYVQAVINGNRLVAGDGSTGYTANGDYLGVPVVIPVNYVAGDPANNRRISSAIASAIAAAIESNPSLRSTVYVRSFGTTYNLDPVANATSDTAFVTIASTTFDGNVSVVTQVNPVGSAYVLMQNAYDIQNIVGQQGNLERVPQDYTQCINTAFDGQQDQGYLITPTAYAQFDAEGRALVGAAAAAHCENNNFKWMALADPGPFLVTDVNKYKDYVPFKAAESLNSGSKYLVDNTIYEWTGTDVTNNRATYQTIIGGVSAQEAVTESVNTVGSGARLGLLDSAVYTLTSGGNAGKGVFDVTTTNYWPATYSIQEVVLTSPNDVTNDFYVYNGQTLYAVAAPYDTDPDNPYPLNYLFLTTTPAAATALLKEVILAGGAQAIIAGATAPTGAITTVAGSGDTCTITYTTPAWDLPVTINGQTSDLIQNTSSASLGINTLHLPGTLQSPTATYRLGFVSRTIVDPSVSITSSATYTGAAEIACVGHGLLDGQRLYFTQSVYDSSGAVLFLASTKIAQKAYYVKTVSVNAFVLAESLSAYTAGSYVQFPSTLTPLSDWPTIFYSNILGGGQTATVLAELDTIPVIRGRKYAFNSGTIYNEAINSTVAPTTAAAASQPLVSIFYNNSSVVLGETQINPFAETSSAGWQSEMVLIPSGAVSTTTANYYCVPTVAQNFSSEFFLVPSIDPILGGDYSAGATPAAGSIAGVTQYVTEVGLANGNSGATVQTNIAKLVGVYFNVTAAGYAPDGTTAVVVGDRIGVTYNGDVYTWTVVGATGDLTTLGQPLYGSQVEVTYSNEITPPSSLWLFDALTSTEIFDSALRGVGFNGVPQAKFVESGVDNVNRLSADSQRYTNPFGFIAYYGPYVENGSGVFIPPSPYVTGVAVRRYRAEGYQFPPAGVKYQLADAVGTQIPINSAQQNLLNPEGCNAIRSLPGYPQTAVYIWGGRTRVNTADAQQRLYQFVNTRVILNIVYGSLRGAFDTQIFNVIDGFGVVFNQIVTIGNSVLNQLYVRGALYGARPSDAFQVICDGRINPPESLENGIVNAKVFVTPVSTLERIQIDLIRVAIGQMNKELTMQGLNQNA